MPGSLVESAGFEKLIQKVGPYFREKVNLKSVMIYAKSFPGRDNFAASLSHIKFIKNHHQKVKKPAAIINSTFLSKSATIYLSFWSGRTMAL
jgi:hypothetical protein